MDGVKRLKFQYTNHRDELHTYLVVPMSLAFGNWEGGADLHWTLHCQVLERDGVERPGVRSFKLTGLREVVEVDA